MKNSHSFLIYYVKYRRAGFSALYMDEENLELAKGVTSSFKNSSRVKSWAIQSFLTFDSMDRTLKCDCLFFNFILFGKLRKIYQFWT